MENVLKTNIVRVTGTLVEVNLETKQSQNTGNDFISGSIVIKSVIAGREQLTDIHLYASSVKKDGGSNKFFETYGALEGKIGKRISVQGEIEENRYYNEGSGQVISFNRNKGTFINDAKSNEVDQAKFEFAGYVIKPVSERVDKDGNVLFYEISLAQSNYNGTMPIVAKFTINDMKIVKVVETLYEKGLTVKVMGDVSIISEMIEYTEETAFGEPVVKESQRTYRNYIVTSGTEPATKGFYTDEQIIELDSAYMAKTAELESGAKKDVLNGKTETVAQKPAAKKPLNSLLL